MPKRETPRIVLNYLQLLKERQYPYYLIAKKFVDDAEAYYKPRSPAEVIYTLNPKWLYRELDPQVKHEKLTVKNISRIILAFLTGKKLKYYTTTTSGGCRSYHIELTPQVIQKLKNPDKDQI